MRRPLLACSLVLAACTSAAPSDAGRDASLDAARLDAARPDAGPVGPRFWPRTLPSTSTLGTVRGRSIARTTVHLHSPLSHDACDGEGWVDGVLADAACLAHLREALCSLRLDAAMLTDHAPHVDEVSLERGLWLQPGDEPIVGADGSVTAGRLVCPDGHRVLLTVGSENALMALGLDRHPTDPADPAALLAAYDADGPEGAATFRAAGALVWQAHTEGRSLETLRGLGLDGLEIYNLHANVGPDIREEHLGLDPFGYVSTLLEFTNERLRLPPDLAVLAFLSENQPSLDRWDALLAEGQRVAGSAGCDAHENTLPMPMADGERADSYRRMMIWVQNHVLVDDPTSPASLEEALDRGRLYVAFEVFGTPVGFDFHAEATDGSMAEMGDDAPLGATLRVTAPRLPEGFPSEPAPRLTLRVLRSTAEGAVEVVRSEGASIEHVVTEPGPYRAEVRMIPEHARPALGTRADALIRELVWVYSNPIFVGMPAE